MMGRLDGISDGEPVLVTGASGLVGSRVIPLLAERYRVRGLDLVAGGSGGVAVAGVDLADFSAVREAVEGAAAVVHLAIASQRALAHLDEHAYAAEEVRVNVLGTRNVLEASALAGVDRVVLFSSLTIHLGLPPRTRIDAATSIRPTNHYAVTKLYGEQLAWLYANQGRLSAVCWRLGQPYPVDFFGPAALADPGHRAIAVSGRDMARGVVAGLTADLSNLAEAVVAAEAQGLGHRGGMAWTGGSLGFTRGFAVANLVSASDAGPEHGYDLGTAEALGYRPADRFTAEGPVDVSSSGA